MNSTDEYLVSSGVRLYKWNFSPYDDVIRRSIQNMSSSSFTIIPDNDMGTEALRLRP